MAGGAACFGSSSGMNQFPDRALCIWLASHLDGTDIIPFKAVRPLLLRRGWVEEADDWGGSGFFNVTPEGFEAVKAWVASELIADTPLPNVRWNDTRRQSLRVPPARSS